MRTDIPSRRDVETLAAIRDPGCVSIYIPTSTKPTDSERARIELKNHVRSAIEQLKATGADESLVSAITSSINDYVDDPDFWAYQSCSLALFVNGSVSRSYRLPNDLGSTCDVFDRFYIKPLLRAVSFPRSAYVLALSQNSVRLLEVTAEFPVSVVEVPDLPRDMESANDLDANNPRDAKARGEVDEKVRIREYARAIDHALRPVLAASSRPVILAGAEPIASIFRSVCSYPQLADEVISGNPRDRSDDDLADAAREILSGRYESERAALKDNMQTLAAQEKAVTAVDAVARAATYRAIDTLLVDVDHPIFGTIDEDSGEVTLADAEEATRYGIVDEVVRRAMLSDARIFAVHPDDIPDGSAMAASLRFPV